MTLSDIPDLNYVRINKLKTYKFNKENFNPTPTMKHLSVKRVCKYCGKVAGIMDRWKTVCKNRQCQLGHFKDNNKNV